MNDNNDIIISDIRVAGRGGLAGEADRWVAQGYARGAARSKRMGDQVLRLRMSTGTATDRVLRLFDCSHNFLLDRIRFSSERTARPWRSGGTVPAIRCAWPTARHGSSSGSRLWQRRFHDGHRQETEAGWRHLWRSCCCPRGRRADARLRPLRRILSGYYIVRYIILPFTSIVRFTISLFERRRCCCLVRL